MQCKKCGIQYVGSTSPEFRMRLANYKSCSKRHNLGKQVPQQSFHDHFKSNGHKRTSDWDFILIDQAKNLPTVRKKESFWQYTLNTFLPEGLNDKDVPLDYG